jgi:hypothetical protein
MHKETYSLNSNNFNSIMKSIKQKINPELTSPKTNSNLISRNLKQATSITNMHNDQPSISKERTRSNTKYRANKVEELTPHEDYSVTALYR